jgi:hypothetical protein
MTIALPHRLHGVFVEGAKRASMPLGMYVVQMIEAAWSERCGVGEAAPLPQLYVLDQDTGVARPVPEPVVEPVEAASVRKKLTKKVATTPKTPPTKPSPKIVEAVRSDQQGLVRIVVNPPAPAQVAPPARKLAPAEVRAIKGLLAAGVNAREITRDYGYTAAQIAAARGQS